MTVYKSSHSFGPPGIRLHFHTMSSNNPHPLAHTKYGVGADIYQHCSNSIMGAEMQILDDMLALHTFNDLFIWNWHTGDLAVHLRCDPRSMTEFDFLSRRHFMIVDSSTAQIKLYDLHDKQDSSASEMKPKVNLDLPDAFTNVDDKRIWTHTSPFVTHRSDKGLKPYPGSGSEVLPFKPAESSRIHVLTVELILDRPGGNMYFFVTIKNSWLLKCLEEHGQGKNPHRLRWSEWGKKYSHWHRTERMHAWLR